MSTAVVVIGAGIAGASAAWHLAEHCNVTIVEREPQPGLHATGRSAALLTETSGPPVVCALAAASRPFLASPPADFVDHPLLSPRGLLHIARPDEAALLDEKVRAASELGIVVRRLDPPQCQQLLPVLRPEVHHVGAYEPEAMSIDVDALLQGYLRGARERGAALHLGADITEITRDGGRWSVRTNTMRWECDVLVNAAGAWCDHIAALAGVRPLGLRPLRRSVFVFPPGPSIDSSSWPMVWDVANRFYFEPEGGMILASPADEIPSEPCDAKPREQDIALGVEELEAATTLQVRGVRHTWAGLRTFSPDGVPIVGFDPTAPGFFWLAGQAGYGIKTSPALGQLTAELVTGAEGPLARMPLEVERFGGAGV